MHVLTRARLRTEKAEPLLRKQLLFHDVVLTFARHKAN
jgi:hypothetical protein